MSKQKFASGIFIAAVLLYAGIGMTQEPTAPVLSQRPTIDLIFQMHESTQQLEVQWFAATGLRDFILRVETESGVSREIPVSDQSRYFLGGIDPNDRFTVSVVAVDAGKNEIAHSPAEKWLGLAEQARLQKQTSTSIPLAANLNAILNSIDSNNFPFIFTAVSIDTNNVPVGTLTKTNFSAFEDGRLQTDFFTVIPPDTSGGVRIADFVFVIDNSGSMTPEHQAVKDNVKAFVDSLVARNINAQLGLVRFGQGAGGGEPIVVNNGILTGNVVVFKSLLDQMTTDGSFEPGIRAVNAAATSFAFRPGSQRHFLLITDEDSDGGNLSQTISICKSNGITVHSAIDCNHGTANHDYCANGTSIRGATNGLLFNVVGPYNQILNLITGQIGNTYIVRYRTDNPACDGQLRQVRIVVNAFSETDDAIGGYIPCAAPVIERTQPTKDLSKSAQVAGSALTIEAEITDAAAPFVQGATCFYRMTGATPYTAISMAPIGNNIYRAIIPGSGVQTPGVDYYLTATDGQVTSSDPPVDPNTFPYQIAVLPNTPPLITHTPVRTAPPGSNVVIPCTVVDNTNFLTTVELRYREFGTLLFKTIDMANLGSNQYEATIPGNDVTTSGVEYFIRAVDNFGLSATHGVHLIQVGSGSDCAQNFTDDFNDGLADGWLPNTASSWTVRQVRGSNAYCLDVASQTGDEWSLIAGTTWGDFTLDLDAESTNSSAPNYFILFGVQNISNSTSDSYYLQFRDGAVNLFRSVNANGTVIATTPQDFASDNQRHHIRVERSGANIKIYADGQLLFEVNDSMFDNGNIGIGSFKNTACFDNIDIKTQGTASQSLLWDFENGNASGFFLKTPSSWSVRPVNGNNAFCIDVAPQRGNEFSIVQGTTWGDFTLDLDAQSTTPGSYNNYFIIFGVPDITTGTGYSYYLQFGYNVVNLFLDINHSGTIIATRPLDFVSDSQRHHIRVERIGTRIKAFADGQFLFEVDNSHFGAGYIGFGSFRSTACFDNISITAFGCDQQSVASCTIPGGLKVSAGSTLAVPVIVSTTEDIGLAQFTVEYNGNVLQFSNAAIGPDAPGFSVSQVQTNPPFPPTTPGTDSNVVVQISGGGGNSFTGNGKTVVFLNFQAVGSAGDTTVLAFDPDCARTFLSTTSLQDICGDQLNRNNGSTTIIISPPVQGHIRYYTANRAVPNADITLSGAIQQTRATDSNGFYQFTNITPGNYTLRPGKNDDIRSAISGSDALALLQAIGFIITLTPGQVVAGDVDGNSSISPADAVAVLRYLAFQPSGIASTGDWKFEPSVASIQVSTGVTQDFIAHLLGDVTGNWGSSVTMPAAAQFTGLKIDQALLQGDTLRIPFFVPDEAATVYTVVANLQWETVVEKNAKFMPVKTNAYFALNTTDAGKIHFALACLDGFQAGKKIGELVVQIPENRNETLHHVATVTSLQVNDHALEEKKILIALPVENIPKQFALYQNYPNPFNINTTIRFAVPKLEHQQEIVLEIYSLHGRLIRQLYKGEAEPGFHTANWDGRDETGKIVGTGLYLYRLRSGSFAKSAKLLLVK